jgi:polar amino acid transport system substrate-binding protein
VTALRLGCAALDARPLFWTDEDGSRHGFEPAVGAALAGALGRPLEWVFLRWADFVPALEAGDCDGVLCGQAITPERQERVDFTRPYAVFDEAVLVRAGDVVGSPADLAGRRVGAIAGSTNMALARTFAGAEPVGFDGTGADVFAEMLDALRAGEVDAVVDDEPAFAGLADPGFAVAFTCPTGNAWGIAVRKGDPLRAELDAALKQLDLIGLRACWFS